MIRRRLVCHILAATFSVCVVGPLAFTILDREPPFVLRDGHIVQNELKPGRPYQFNWELIPLNNKQCTATVQWKLVDAQSVMWATPPTPSLFVNLPRERRRVVGRGRILPSNIPTGPIKLESSMSFVCNWTQSFWPIHVEFPPIESVVSGG